MTESGKGGGNLSENNGYGCSSGKKDSGFQERGLS